MTGEADITTALGRALAALSNAGAAVASLASVVGDAQKAAERREREAQRVIVDAEARCEAADHDVANLRAELAKSRTDGEQERKAYRRGYQAGRASAQRGAPSDPEGALDRRQLRSVS